MTRADVTRFLRDHDDYVILTHRRPDGDTIGSAVGLCRGLRALGKRAHVLENPQFTPRFAPWLEGLVCKTAADSATVIAVDTADQGLLLLGGEDLLGRIRLTIDHHGKSSLPVENRLIEPERAACGEIIYGLLKELCAPVDKTTAEALYIALSTDTGCFKYTNVTAQTMRIAADLMDRGADVGPINKVFFDTKTFSRLKLEARLTETMERYAGGIVALCTLPQAWLTELSIDEDEIDSISGFARSIEGVEIGITIREVEGGGGHAAAAGASVPGGIDAAKTAILDVLRQNGLVL